MARATKGEIQRVPRPAFSKRSHDRPAALQACRTILCRLAIWPRTSAACHISCLPAADLEKRLLEFGTYDSSLPKPGDLLLQDYRDHDKASQAWVAAARGRPVRVVQWNIERGYKFDEIVQTLKILDADVLLLQEIDVGCDRSGRRDVGVLIPTRARTPTLPLALAMMSPCMAIRSRTLPDLHWAGVGA